MGNIVGVYRIDAKTVLEHKVEVGKGFFGKRTMPFVEWANAKLASELAHELEDDILYPPLLPGLTHVCHFDKTWPLTDALQERVIPHYTGPEDLMTALVSSEEYRLPPGDTNPMLQPFRLPGFMLMNHVEAMALINAMSLALAADPEWAEDDSEISYEFKDIIEDLRANTFDYCLFAFAV